MAFDNWERSGQNNSEKFGDFVSLAPVVTINSWLGLCSVMMFHAFKCGILQQYTELLNFTCKLAPFGAAYVDEEASADNIALGGFSRKSKRLQKKYLIETRKKTKQTEKMLSVTDRVAASLSSCDSKKNSDKTVSMTDIMRKIHELTKQRMELMRMSSNDNFNETSLTLVSTHLERVQDLFKEIMEAQN